MGPSGLHSTFDPGRFDLTVTAGSGAAIRSAPSGAIVARVQKGTLLSKVSTRGTWVRVRRAGWVARGSLQAEPAVKPTVAQAAPPPPTRRDSVKPGSPPPVLPAATKPPGDPPADSTVSDGATVRPGAVLSITPDGKPAATLVQSAEVQVIGRTRDWTRFSSRAGSGTPTSRPRSPRVRESPR